MISSVEIINRPQSGEYKERIYDNDSAWKSADWSWVKFTNDNYDEWCGHFRGASYGAAISTSRNEILVLTSDCLYLLDTNVGNIIEIMESPQFKSITVSPQGDFILADSYHIQRLGKKLATMESINSPVEMDSIVFKEWVNDNLLIYCEEFTNWTRKLELQLNSKTWEIKILKSV
ncbi:hypothetical protein EHQ13_16425 [Leptospira gomenensis]|uniref:WD40 repeat domain-containing protein n=1 Tax=Leptospira gomenensis TaxID=2484974 RepID=A0A5F1YFN4_9LEPT|nr:hypothetical protein [Leptospira gomenensis]TGK38487.1 hypothetical protein EHQ17_02310 [Leptospira gomenensis]TGK42602.1 hypothetical protein EHQ07_14405 [Leptospira gomenensis]TGK55850.1 hypothetical protein EHQ13_16425 [Leptospira gomenensis]